MKPVEPILVLELFPPLSSELISLLKSLQPEDWTRSTVCAPWSVKDVAAHLLDGSLGRTQTRAPLSGMPVQPALGFDELLNQINLNNARWVQAAERISPEILIDFLELADRALYAHFASLNLYAPARITVAWASDELPPNWFDIAREYTEKWLHQQHIRSALGRPLLMERRWLFPVLDTFMRAFPRAFRAVEAGPGTSISVHIAGEAGGNWSLRREDGNWQLYSDQGPRAACRVDIDQNLAWQLFTRGLSPQDVRDQIRIEGDASLGEHVLEMVAIMA